MRKRLLIHENLKIQKIAGEIFLFCQRLKSNHINIDFKNFDDRYELEARCDYDPTTLGQLEILKRYLSVDRQEEIEGYYWELTGNYTDDTALSIVGMMTDDAEIAYDEHEVKIKLIRLK